MMKVMFVFGTRPEAIKMCPVIREFRKYTDKIATFICITGQHREMLQQVMDVFSVKEDYNLDIMKEKQDLTDITTRVLNKLKPLLMNIKPDIVLVHGDTTTTFAASLACFYQQIPVAHIEAGLRTNNLYSPYPEEFNRRVVSVLSRIDFAPTKTAAENLKKEGKKNIYITGNTAIDALKITVFDHYNHSELEWVDKDRLLLLTAHRRENIGIPMKNIFRAIRRIVEEYQDIKVIYPIHKNPIIRDIAREIFENCDRVRLIEPLNVIDFHNFMNRSYLILTDSGGIQEEAPSLGKPVLVLRDTTERPEGIETGTLQLIGTDERKVYENIKRLLEDSKVYTKMAKACNPYGDGKASERICKILLNFVNKK